MRRSSTRTETVLGKRKACDDLVLLLSATSDASLSESDQDPYIPEAGPSKCRAPTIVNGTFISDTKKRYQCTFEGCQKAYTKPSRLEEHERSHTGERPFVCTNCGKSYLRETHLQAHARSHQPQSDRPFTCTEAGCEKRFWTSQHLKAHLDVIHKGEKPFKCSHSSCSAEFLKHHQLRTHLATAHAPPGTKPYQCEHEHCTKSFSTNQKLRAHAKVHSDSRYTCIHEACQTASSDPTYYPTWSALQHHIRTAHPPTCHHETCKGKTFATQKSLRSHMKLHEQRDMEDAMQADGGNDSGEEDEPPKKRRRGGELGRDWKCEEEGCDKDFKSKKALMTHHTITHLGRRDFVCTHASCGRAFGYKHLLQRHVARIHRNATPSSSEDDEQADAEMSGTDGEASAPEPQNKVKATAPVDIDAITGKAYEVRTQSASTRTLHCPYPEMRGLEDALTQLAIPSDAEDTEMIAWKRGGTDPCQYVFNRAYDLRRHLKAVHEVELEKEVVDAWARRQRV